MPFQKKFLLLCAIAACLGITLLAGLLVKNFQHGQLSEQAVLAPALTEQNMTSFTLSREGTTISLRKADNAWWAESGGDSWPVRPSRVEDLMKSLQAMKSLRVAAQSVKGYEELRITDNLASSLAIADASGKTVQTLLFGAVSNDGSEQFLRDASKPAVLAVKSGSTFWLQQSAQYWYDKQLWPTALKPSDIIACQYRSSKTGLINLVRQTKEGVDSWQAEGKEAAKVLKDRLAGWTQNLFSLEGDELLALNAGAIPAGYQEALRIGVRDKNGQDREAIAYSPAKSGDPWLIVPQFADARKTRNGTTLVLKMADWKLQRAVMGDQ